MKEISTSNYQQDKYYDKVLRATREVLLKKNEISVPELFMGIGVLDESDYQRWLKGQVPYLEKVIKCNLSKAKRVLRIFRFHAHDLKMKRKLHKYNWKGSELRFSKTRDRGVEESYRQCFSIIGPRERFLEKKLGVGGTAE